MSTLSPYNVAMVAPLSLSRQLLSRLVNDEIRTKQSQNCTILPLPPKACFITNSMMMALDSFPPDHFSHAR